MSCLRHRLANLTIHHASTSLHQSHTTQHRTFAVFKTKDVKIAVTLTTDEPSLGYSGQTVHVARGYARNVLIPNGTATYTYTKQREQGNHKKVLHAKRDNLAAVTAAPTTAGADVALRQWAESLRTKLGKTTLPCRKQAQNPNAPDTTNQPFVGKPITSQYVYKRLLALYPEINTQLYSDRISLPNKQDITQFGTYPISVQLYPATQNTPVEVQLQVLPAASNA